MSAPAPGDPSGSAPAQRLTALHRELGISPRYAFERALALHSEADEMDLVAIATNDEGQPIRLRLPAARAWSELQRAAQRDRVTLIPISGFRSVARQAVIIREKLKAGRPLEDILRYIAAPGFSEHHTGDAIDLASPDHLQLDERFDGTAAFRWLQDRAREFGFHLSYPRGNAHGIGYEPWHWCWRPENPPGS